MTVIRPNSISGVTSITAQGGDINVYRADGTKSDIFITNITGVAATFTGNLNIGGTLTYEDVANIDSVGIITARTDVLVGNNIKLGASSGIVTATSFSGSGANLTGINADLVNDTSPQLGGNLDTNSHNIFLDDDHKVIFGNDQSADLHIFHESSSGTGNIYNATGELRIRSNDIRLKNLGNSETYLKAQNNGSVELYHDNAVKLTTEIDGIKIHAAEGGEAIISLFADEGDDADDKYRIVAQNSGDLVFQRNNGSAFSSELRVKSAGGIQANYQGSNRAETFSSGFKVAGGGELYIDGNAASGHCQLIMTRSDVSYMMANETFLRFYTQSGNQSSPSNLMAEFTNSGHFRPGADNTYDLGDNTRRWRNLYTTDLKLSNEGSQNDVDGTWGNYTIQEGESDLFLINNRSGKKYKFNLTEVS